MSKIKGWKKSKYGNPLGQWTFQDRDDQTKGQAKNSWYVSPSTIQIDIFQRVKGKNKGLYVVQTWYAKTNNVYERGFFKTQEKAKKYAINWMRSHNG